MVRAYEPTIVEGEQQFSANIISVQKRLIAFGELLAERGKDLKFGTPIHTLLIHVDGANTLFELNDQGNTRDVNDIERLDLTPTTLRIMFRTGRGAYSGRVSLSPKIEIFDRDTHEPKQMRSLLVEMKPTAAQLAKIKHLLAGTKLVAPGSAPAAVASKTGGAATRSRKKSATAPRARPRVQRKKPRA